ncbi:acyl-CoA thioesterase [Aerococcus suis]|uniref:Acyl-CoA hydrolase n=1 Tax=Aerococcus suis TaxID=371602 RepID=A0A1W1Z588_9LACT|nr:acyl-CoA thioesterase [Aerococcus suis]MCI7240034.1 acyl-CoA thioesterase [Aerococcus suis]MDD7758623.1 acyl-CoA thioesterase [Aerococcus suis]MDY4646743.1 acyl-CoA thioesterase [Aerococcus suis]SMC43650.1 Acyl-CoA hydrolase [Aerococcus suis]
MQEITCKETLAVQTHLILPSHTNSFGNMFGGQLLAFIDNISAIAAMRVTRHRIMTAALDNMNFINPLPERNSVCLECYVSGTGTRSIEVFVKVLGENMLKHERYIAATSYLTFVVVDDDPDFEMPRIVPESDEEKLVCEGYEERRQARKISRQKDKELQEQLSTGIFWLEDHKK